MSVEVESVFFDTFQTHLERLFLDNFEELFLRSFFVQNSSDFTFIYLSKVFFLKEFSH